MRYDKDEILALYAAHAPFGGNVVGLEAASWRYFGRGPRDLSWAEAATLAVLPNNPSLVHVSRNRERLQAKRDELLRRLQRREICPRWTWTWRWPNRWWPRRTSCRTSRRTCSRRCASKFPAQHRLRTTLDARLQASARAQLNEHWPLLARQQVHNAAALILDN